MTEKKISGRISAENAAEFEKELLSAADGGDTVLDAAGLEYISSAGLRALLKLKKSTNGKVSVINVSNEVYDIFNVTGFTDILDVRKAFREVDITGMELIGKGATGCVYRADRETIIKLFNPGTHFDLIERENIKAKNAFLFGVPTAISYDIVRCGDRYGTVYEMLDAEDLLNIIRRDRAHLKEHITDFALKMRSMNSIEVDGRFDDVRRGTIDAFKYLEGKICTAEEVKKFTAVIENVPERSTFLHGDAHVGNVMIQNGEYMFIDLSTAGKGHPIFDMVSMYSGYRAGQAMTEEQREAREMTKGFSIEELRLIWHTYLTAYLGTENEDILKRAEDQIGAVAYARTMLAAVFLPGLLAPETIARMKAAVIAHCDKGLEPIDWL